MAIHVGVRDLKAHLSAYIDRVQAGEDIVVTEHGRPVCRLVAEPGATAATDEKLWAMVRAGKVSWSGRKLGPPVAAQAMTRGPSAAEMVAAAREADESRLLGIVLGDHDDALPRQ